MVPPPCSALAIGLAVEAATGKGRLEQVWSFNESITGIDDSGVLIFFSADASNISRKPVVRLAKSKSVFKGFGSHDHTSITHPLLRQPGVDRQTKPVTATRE